MKIGIKGIEVFKVSEKNTAQNMHSGTLDVLSTPYLIAKMEECAWKSVQPFLDKADTTVGCHIDVQHISPTPITMEVQCTSTLTQINGRELIFQLTAFDEQGLIAEGTHKRVIVQAERFLEKANLKKKT